MERREHKQNLRRRLWQKHGRSMCVESIIAAFPIQSFSSLLFCQFRFRFVVVVVLKVVCGCVFGVYVSYLKIVKCSSHGGSDDKNEENNMDG